MKNSINKFTSINEGLLSSYIQIGWFIIPMLFIQLLSHYLGFYEFKNYQLIISVFGLSGLIIFQLFKNTSFLKQNFYIIQVIYLISIIIIEFVWYYTKQGDRQLISLILSLTITGIALVKPKISIVFFIVSITTLIGINFTNDYKVLNNLHYFILSAICIVTFNYWRENLVRLLKLSQTSYKNIFSDSQSLIFVVEKNNFTIIESNKLAHDYISKFNTNQFLNIFNCSQEKQIIKTNLLLISSNNDTITFETDCDEKNHTYIPKEFSFKYSTFFDSDVIIIQVKLIKDKKENEKQLKETKDNITTILENINSFIYNIICYDNDDIQVRFISTKAKEILDIEIDELIVMFKSRRTKDLLHPDDLDYVQEKVKEASLTLKIQKLEYRLIINNEVRWFEETIFPKKDNLGIVHFGIVTDVTEHKNDQILLINSEEKHRQLFEKSLAGIYKTTEEGKIIDANQAFASMLGFESVNDFKSKNIKDFYFEETDRIEYIDKLKENISISNHITILKTIDNKQLIASNNAFIFKEDNTIFITGTIIDVTELHNTTEELKKNEIILKESQSSFKSIIENSPSSLFIFNSKNKLVFKNNNGKNLINNFLDNSTLELETMFGKAHRFVIQNLINETNNPIQSYTQIDLINKITGVEHYFSIQNVKVNYNKETTNLLLFRDVTVEHEFKSQKLRAELAEEINVSLEKEIHKHKLTQKKLVENKNFINSLFNSSLDMIIATDINNIITLVNKAATIKFGYTEDEMIGQNLSLIISSKNKTSNNPHKLLNVNKFIGEVDNVTKEGLEFKSYLSATKTLNDNNEVIGFMGISRDLSEIKEIQNIITTQSSLIDSLFENESDIFIWTLNKKLELKSCNDATITFLKKINNNKEVVLGVNFIEQIKSTIETGYFDKTLRLYKKAINGEKIHFEAKTLDESNNEFWIDIYLTPVVLPDGTIQEIICLGTDITDQKNKIRIIKENEMNIKGVIEAIPDMIFRITETGIITNFNINNSLQEDLLNSFIGNIDLLIGKSIKDIYKNNSKFGNEILDYIITTINTSKILTQDFNYKFNDKTYYFENRFSKISDNEVIIVVREKTIEIENKIELTESLHEKEVLLKEVHHRVKNNLQIINSILNLQSSYIEDEKTLEIISDSQNRIRSMSFIHESLYQTNNFSSINFKEYIENLLSNLAYSYQVGTKIKINKNIENIDLSLDQAIPCGLILNELITNALKYAYDINEEGNVDITINNVGSKVQMSIQDYGKGLPKDFDIETADSLGLSLVHTLTDQIDGELIVKSDGGTKILIIFEML